LSHPFESFPYLSNALSSNSTRLAHIYPSHYRPKKWIGTKKDLERVDAPQGTLVVFRAWERHPGFPESTLTDLGHWLKALRSTTGFGVEAEQGVAANSAGFGAAVKIRRGEGRRARGDQEDSTGGGSPVTGHEFTGFGVSEGDLAEFSSWIAEDRKGVSRLGFQAIRLAWMTYALSELNLRRGRLKDKEKIRMDVTRVLTESINKEETILQHIKGGSLRPRIYTIVILLCRNLKNILRNEGLFCSSLEKWLREEE